jgi:hypothetical protein
MDETSTSQFIKNAVGAGVRWVLLLASGILIKKGIINSQQSELYIAQVTPVLIGAAMAGVTLLWSLYQKKKANKKVDVALTLPAGTERATLEKVVDKAAP